MANFYNTKAIRSAAHLLALILAGLGPLSLVWIGAAMTLAAEPSQPSSLNTAPGITTKAKQLNSPSVGGYVEFDFPPRVLLAEILYPKAVTDKTGKTIAGAGRIFARGRFRVPTSLPLTVFLKYDSIANMQYIEHLKSCHVVILNSENLDFDDKHLNYLKDFKDLQQISLYGTLITDKSMPLIGRFDSLFVLHMSRTGVTGEGFKYLANLKHLKYLYASNIALKEGSIGLLRPLAPSLTHLDIGRTGLAKEDIAQIPFFPNLINLDVSCNNQVGNNTTKLFTHLSRLETLHIEDTGITDQSLPILLKLPKLKTVFVRNRRFWHSGKPPATTGHIKFVDVATTENSTLELLTPLH